MNSHGDSVTQSVASHNADVFRDRGVGGWEKLYAHFLSELRPSSLSKTARKS